jgi:hypothetical protein
MEKVMSEKINGVFVTLDHDIKDEQAEWLLNAIRMIRGVIDVTPNVVDHGEAYVAEVRVRSELSTKLFEVLRKN